MVVNDPHINLLHHPFIAASPERMLSYKDSFFNVFQSNVVANAIAPFIARKIFVSPFGRSAAAAGEGSSARAKASREGGGREGRKSKCGSKCECPGHRTENRCITGS